MKKAKSNLLLVVLIFGTLMLLVACSGQTTISDGTYDLRNEGIKANPYQPPVLVPPFKVNGSVIT